MQNIHYDTIMVEDTPEWRQVVKDLIEGEDATASFHKRQKNGLLIRVGSPDKAVLQKIREKATEL